MTRWMRAKRTPSVPSDMLVVTDDAFYFRAYVKHTDVAVECASQPIAELAAHFAIPFEDPRHKQGN